MLSQALAQAKEIDKLEDKIEVFGEIALLQSKIIGGIETARATLSLLTPHLRGIQDDYRRVGVLTDVAETQARIAAAHDANRSFKEAKSAADRVGDPFLRVQAITAIATAEARAAKLDS